MRAYLVLIMNYHEIKAYIILGFYLLTILVFAKPILSLLFCMASTINSLLIQKLVQMWSTRDIIVMSQGGKDRNGKGIHKQRSSHRKRSFR